ncbi:MAG TPA: hypothetical protein VGL89_11910 [Candidatus Koribacter sp.]|jgi:hypothetical protein
MPLDRRQFVAALVVSGAAVAVPAKQAEGKVSRALASWQRTPELGVDFRYSPHQWQSAICLPDDPHKTVIGNAGDLRYGFAHALMVGMEDFAMEVGFSLSGFDDDEVVKQWLESPGVPIVHTLIERPAATLELIAFATGNDSEGRVDNVLMTVRSKRGSVDVVPRLRIRSCEKFELADYNGPVAIVGVHDAKSPLLVAAQIGSDLGKCGFWEEEGFTVYLTHGEATETKEARYFIRLPQENQTTELLRGRLHDPDALLADTREFWKNWKAFGRTDWSYPSRHGEFLTACARNIQQAREVKDGRLVFQVGPTVYRGLWIVDGNFLLEAARYLGYDHEADEGLRSEWSKQLDTGQVVAGGGGEHWKDTAIAMFTLVRQCELKQDWALFRELEPNVLRAIKFLEDLRDKARAGSSTNGHYGLLAPGFADGGISGLRSEFTNSVWTLAGLRAVSEAAERLKMPALNVAGEFYRELYSAFQAMAKQEMVRHPDGFEYLPMLAKEDPIWQERDPWERPRPQSAQWALSHAIYPGVVFDRNDPIVKGHIALMQSCTREDVPIETGWLWHDALWNYNASFVAHVYLWAGLRDRAHRTFTGFLNHASPLYCWREEQPLQNALVGQEWGDMPHNWASAECVRYLRHMLALEDRQALRLLEGVPSLTRETNYELKESPTRFGRINLKLENLDARRWRVKFERPEGPAPKTVTLPTRIGEARMGKVTGAESKPAGATVEVDPNSKTWEAVIES